VLKISWCKEYKYKLPEGHRFPMEKYELIPEQLLYEGTINKQNLYRPAVCLEKDVLAIHTNSYWQKIKTGQLSYKEERKIGFPQSTAFTKRSLLISQGTVENALFAQKHGVAINVAGGTHHAYANSGEGFCMLNDFAIAARYLLDNQLAKQILIVDLDVHQGNGNAKIFETDNQVYTFSMHGANNYPMHKEVSNLDVPLPDGTDDKSYLNLLDHHLKSLIDELAPDFIFYQAGVDVLATDRLGKLSLSRAGCMQRDKLVLEVCKRNNIPVAISMGGGYSPKLADIIEAHCNTYRQAQEIYF